MKKLRSSMVMLTILVCSYADAIGAPVIVGIPLENDDGVTTDLFDVAQGTIVLQSSPLFFNFTAEGTFGSTSLSAIEGHRTIFSDVARPTDFIEFKTPTPVNLESYRFVLGEDGDGTGNRGSGAFRLFASSQQADLLSNLVSSTSIPTTFTANFGSPQIAISDTVNTPNVQYFRLEVDRIGSGPRIFELDGFGVAVPEPAGLTLIWLALCTLTTRRRSSRWHRGVASETAMRR